MSLYENLSFEKELSYDRKDKNRLDNSNNDKTIIMKIFHFILIQLYFTPLSLCQKSPKIFAVNPMASFCRQKRKTHDCCECTVLKLSAYQCGRKSSNEHALVCGQGLKIAPAILSCK